MGLLFHWIDSDIYPCVKFQIEKSDLSNPSSENKIPLVVSTGIEILLQTSLSHLIEMNNMTAPKRMSIKISLQTRRRRLNLCDITATTL